MRRRRRRRRRVVCVVGGKEEGLKVSADRVTRDTAHNTLRKADTHSHSP